MRMYYKCTGGSSNESTLPRHLGLPVFFVWSVQSKSIGLKSLDTICNCHVESLTKRMPLSNNL